jgi:hypothetical protein
MKAESVFVISGRVLLLLSCILVKVTSLSAADHKSFVGRFDTISSLASTVPPNGDVNPYGVAVVKRSTGALVRDHVLVSNFNNGQNLQGTGTTIMDIAPDGTASVFAQLEASDPNVCSDGIGLTTALVVLRSGWVIVGSLPTTDGSSSTATAGCLIVLDSNGHAVENISGGPINGPWDMTAVDGDDWAVLFVTNVLNGTVAAGGNLVNQGTVVRIALALDEDEMPSVSAENVIASGFPERTDPAALVIGPTGVGFGDDGTLYVADTVGNRIAAIPQALSRKTDAGSGDTFSSGGALNGPLGLAIAPNGNILVVNSNDGNLVETSADGNQIVVMNVDSTGIGAGTLFGLAVAPRKKGIYFVNDGDNTLNLLH